VNVPGIPLEFILLALTLLGVAPWTAALAAAALRRPHRASPAAGISGCDHYVSVYNSAERRRPLLSACVPVPGSQFPTHAPRSFPLQRFNPRSEFLSWA